MKPGGIALSLLAAASAHASSKSLAKHEPGFDGFSSTPNLEYSARYRVQLCP